VIKELEEVTKIIERLLRCKVHTGICYPRGNQETEESPIPEPSSSHQALCERAWCVERHEETHFEINLRANLEEFVIV